MLDDYVVVDLEMTGLNPKTDEILEAGAVKVRGGKVAETYSAMICVKCAITPKITELTGITEEMSKAGRDGDEVAEELLAFLGTDILVGQNIIFDYSFLKQWAVNHKRVCECQAVDTLKLARKFLPHEQKKDLESLCDYFQIKRENAHRALEDALETHQILERLKQEFGEEKEAFTPKPLQYKAKKQSPATERQKKYLKQYAAYFGLKLPKDAEYMTKSEASRLTDIWLSKYGKLPEQLRGNFRETMRTDHTPS